MSGRHCYLCKNKHTTGVKSSFSLHKFPTDPEIRSMWIQCCDLYANDDVTGVKLCSDHFVPKDYINYNTKQAGGLLKLKYGAVPSVNVPNPMKTDTIFTLNVVLPAASTMSEVTTGVDQAVPSLTIDTAFLNNVQCNDKSTEFGEHINIMDVDAEGNIVITAEEKRVAEPCSAGAEPSSAGAEPRSAGAEPCSAGGDKTCSDKSKQSNKQIICTLKQTIYQQSKEIKELRTKNKKLLEHIAAFKELVRCLRKK